MPSSARVGVWSLRYLSGTAFGPIPAAPLAIGAAANIAPSLFASLASRHLRAREGITVLGTKQAPSLQPSPRARGHHYCANLRSSAHADISPIDEKSQQDAADLLTLQGVVTRGLPRNENGRP